MAVSPYGSIMKAPATVAERVVYTASGTFNKADYPGLKYVRVRCVGGGGGSGGAAGGTGVGEGGGGGGGGYAESYIPAANLTDSETVTVGAGGGGGAAGQNSGSAGGNSSFGTHVAASGGGGGTGSANTTSSSSSLGGEGGVGTAGQVSIQGGTGGMGLVLNGLATRTTVGGNSGMAGSRRVRTGAATSGQDGRAWGGGAHGAIATSANLAGAPGAPGVVIVDVYVQEQGLVGDTGFVHPNQFPKGELAYAEVTASQTGIASKTDLAGLSVTINVAGSRRIRISFDGSFLVETNGDAAVAWVQEGTTVLAEVVRFRAAYINDQRHAHGAVVLTPTAGSHTYKVTADEVVGTGNVRLVASADSPAFLLVEDLGPA